MKSPRIIAGLMTLSFITLSIAYLSFSSRRLVPAAPPIESTSTPARTTAPAPASTEGQASSQPVNRRIALEQFSQWLRQQQSPVNGGQTLNTAALAQGIKLAEARRPAMRQLMKQNPAEALAQSLRWDEWAALPAAIQALVEKPFSEIATLSVTPDCRPADQRQTPWQTHRLVLSDSADGLDAFVDGQRQHLTTKVGAPLQGFTLDGQAAIWDSPIYRLGATELVAAQQRFPDGNARDRSWITGQPLSGAATTALIGGQIHYFASEEELTVVEKAFVAAEKQMSPHSVSGAMQASAAGGVFDPAAFVANAVQLASVWTETPKKALAFVIAFSATPSPYIASEILSDLNAASNSIRTMSFGKTYILPTATSLLTLPNSRAFYETNSNEKLSADAKALAVVAGFNPANYDIHVFCFPGLARITAPAFADVNGPNQFVNGRQQASVNVHEFGHNYGLGHANSWLGVVTGNGFTGHGVEHQEYGDVFDLMGNDRNVLSDGQSLFAGTAGHFSMRGKSILNWIEASEVQEATTNGVYRIRRFDDPNSRALAGGKLALKLHTGNNEELWVGYRANLNKTKGGAYIIWANDPLTHRLLDTTPLSASNNSLDREDGVLPTAQVYQDPAHSIRITMMGSGGSTPNEYIEVEVAFTPGYLPTYQLFTSTNRTTNGLIGSYVNTSLRSRVAQEDWRSTAGVVISGRRIDPTIQFTATSFGLRQPVGITGGTDADWEDFSVQWDGVIQINQLTRLATRSDDGSRMWIDVNGDGKFAATATELVNNNWGNGQAATLGTSSVLLSPGAYGIRIQYEEGVGGNSCELVAQPTSAFDLYADSGLATNGLIASFVNKSLRAYSPQDDWRTTQLISGRRLDLYPAFLDDGWGARAPVGLTAGTDDSWVAYSVQWDGWLRVYQPTKFATISDDGSRMWIDLDGNGSFATVSPEFVNNNWGSGQGDTLGEISSLVQPGLYRFRIQYEEGNGANHFVLQGVPVETPGIAGYALGFNGVNDLQQRMEVMDAGLTLPTEEITIEFWQRAYEVKLQSSFGLAPDIASNRISSHVPWVDGIVYWDFGNINTTGRLAYRPSESVIGQWQHWAFVSSKAGGFQRIYRNGVLEAADSTASQFVRNTAALYLGNSGIGATFKGELEEFRIWSIARSEEQIRLNMRCKIPLPQSNLWGYWRFDEGSGVTVADLSGNHHDGTLVNGVNWVVSTAPNLQATASNIVTQLGNDGVGSLRQAILDANNGLCSDRITFAINGVIQLITPLPPIAANLELVGPGQDKLTISGNNVVDIFTCDSGTTNRISGVTLANGFSVNHGAAIRNKGALTLANCTLFRNRVIESFGGAVCNFPGASFTADTCVFKDNSIRGGDGVSITSSINGGPGGGGAGLGGAIFQDGDAMTLKNCTFIANAAIGGNGGRGDRNSFGSQAGARGGFPNAGEGGTIGNVGGAGGFGGGGGGGAGSSSSGLDGGAGGFGGGGGAGGARGSGGNGGAPGLGGPYAGSAGASFSSHSGGGGGGAGLGGGLFVRSGTVLISDCRFTQNTASNGLGGFGSFGFGSGGDGKGGGGAIFNLSGKLTLMGSTFDSNRASTGDPDHEAFMVVTSLADSGAGSLRQAICNAEARSGPDAIQIDPNLEGVIILTSGQFEITQDLTLIAPVSGKVVIDARNRFRHFLLHSGKLTLSGLMLRNGLALDTGGSIRMIGGSLLLDQMRLDSNSSNTDGGAIDTGGLKAEIRKSWFRANRTVSFNGGAIHGGGDVLIVDSTFSLNKSGLRGGAIHHDRGNMSVIQCTFADNSSKDHGGAIAVERVMLNLSRTTITRNTANSDGAGSQFAGGVHNDFGGSIRIDGSIIAGNSAKSSSIPDIFGVYQSSGFNLIGSATGSSGWIETDRVGSNFQPIDPALGALSNNGGPTLTILPLAGSPAMDAGNPSETGFSLNDQRGFPRVSGGRIEIGATENCLRLYLPADAGSLQTDVSGGSILSFNGSKPLAVDDHAGIASSRSLGLNTLGRSKEYYTVTNNFSPTDINSALGIKGDFTLSVWIRPTTVSGDRWIVGNDGPGGLGTLLLGIRNDRAYFGFWDNDLGGNRLIPVDVWTHIAVTYKQQGGQLALYVNGQLDASDIGRVNNLGAHTLLIGWLGGAAVESQYSGYIDELAFFCDALAPNQIATLSMPSITADTRLSDPSIGLPPAPFCDWYVREVYAHTNDPVLLPFDLPGAEYVASSTQFARTTNYSSAVINRYDPDTNPGGAGFFGAKVPWAANNLTPQGLLNTDDDYLVLAANTTVQILEEDDYTFGFNTDDGARLRVLGAHFNSSTDLAAQFGWSNLANPPHAADQLIYPGNTAISATLGVVRLKPGNYPVEFLSWERGGGSYAEVFATRGARTEMSIHPTGIYNTGLDLSGQALTGGDIDPHYRLVDNPDGGSPNASVHNSIPPISPAGPWIANTPDSKWISPRANSASTPAGSFTYRLNVDLTGRDLARVRLTGRWASDDGSSIRVNGVATEFGLTPAGGTFQSWHPFSLTPSNAALTRGTNSIDFVVRNDNGPTGLRVEFTEAVTPDDGFRLLNSTSFIHPVLNIRPVMILQTGLRYQLSWSPASSCHRLQASDSIEGPWSDLNLANGSVVTPTPQAKFFRLTQ